MDDSYDYKLFPEYVGKILREYKPNPKFRESEHMYRKNLMNLEKQRERMFPTEFPLPPGYEEDHEQKYEIPSKRVEEGDLEPEPVPQYPEPDRKMFRVLEDGLTEEAKAIYRRAGLLASVFSPENGSDDTEEPCEMCSA